MITMYKITDHMYTSTGLHKVPVTEVKGKSVWIGDTRKALSCAGHSFHDNFQPAKEKAIAIQKMKVRAFERKLEITKESLMLLEGLTEDSLDKRNLPADVKNPFRSSKPRVYAASI